MFEIRKYAMLLTIMFLIGTSMGSENSEDSLETPKHFPAKDVGIADVFNQPLQHEPKAYLEHESEEHLSKGLPESAILGAIVVAESAKSKKIDPGHLSYKHSESHDGSKNAEESIDRGETEEQPVFLKENEISGNKVEAEHAGNVQDFDLLGGIFSKGTTKNPDKDSTTEGAMTTSKPACLTAAHGTQKPEKSTHGTQRPKKDSHGKSSKADGRKIVKIESSESNAFRNSDASLACFIFNLVLAVAIANYLTF